MNRPPLVTLPHTEVHRLTSESTGESFELWIGHPLRGWASREDEAPRVLYLLDANLFFGMAVEMTRLMHTLFGELPPILVVGIAYPDVDPATQSRLRTGHFTPSEDRAFAEAARALAPPGGAAPAPPPMGGADDFLTFLRRQVDPWVRARFPATAEFTLFGASLGGLFAVHVLRTAPEWVDHIIATSPSLWWNDDELLRRIEEDAGVSGPAEASRDGAAAGRRLPDVVLAVGGGEEGPGVPRLNRYKLVTNTRRLAQDLAAGRLPARSVHLEVIEGESHTSVVPSALTRGLRRLRDSADLSPGAGAGEGTPRTSSRSPR